MKSCELWLRCNTLLRRHPPKKLYKNSEFCPCEEEEEAEAEEEEEEEEEGHTAESVIQTAYAGPSL